MQHLVAHWKNAVTFGIRLLWFALTLALLGSLLLPWVTMDGEFDARSGVDLIVLAISPTRDYLVTVSPIQAGVLIGAPILAGLAMGKLIRNYARRRTSPASTLVALASFLVIAYATPDLTSNQGPESGIVLGVALAAVLLLHQALIKVRTRLRRKQKWAVAYRALGVATGSQPHPWE